MARVVISPSAAYRYPGHRAMRQMMLPFLEDNGTLCVACADPEDTAALIAIERHTRMSIRAYMAEPESLKQAIQHTYGLSVRPPSATSSTIDESVRTVDEVLTAALLRDASDIHADPARDFVEIRLRVYGQMQFLRQMSTATYGTFLGRIKVLAGMDISEKRLPQDGRITHRSSITGHEFNLRAATVPSVHGEKLTLRLLGSRDSPKTPKDLGMDSTLLEHFSRSIHKPNGLVLITGPTGSGKTCTLYAALRLLSEDRSLNLITIEEPVEFELPGITQIEVDAQRLTFAKSLRSVLRHDPDIILVGEIRDRETADIALRAALTGHLVLSTLHTRTAPAAVTRLLDIGIESYIISATLNHVIGQRLVRRLCSFCVKNRPILPHEERWFDPMAAPPVLPEPGGCIYCGLSGWSGRIALFESLLITQEIQAMINQPDPESVLLAHLKSSLKADAINKIFDHKTTLKECQRVLF